MAIKTRVPAISRTLKLAIDKHLSPEAQSKRLASFAREELGKAEAQNTRVLGYRPTHETYVDGRHGASEDSVKPNGVIVYEFADALRAEVVEFTWNLLKRAAADFIKDGHYLASFRLYADGAEVADFKAAANANEILMMPTVPYARKIERGQGRAPNPPGSVFQGAATAAAARYGNQASIKYTMAVPTGGGTGLEQWAGKTSQSRTRWKRGNAKHERARAEWNRRQPAIRVSFR